jgi:hypothetical protein
MHSALPSHANSCRGALASQPPQAPARRHAARRAAAASGVWCADIIAWHHPVIYLPAQSSSAQLSHPSLQRLQRMRGPNDGTVASSGEIVHVHHAFVTAVLAGPPRR